MMLTIFGLPQKITYNNLKKIIHKECYISQFLLDDFLQDLDGKKKIKICVADDIEANLVKKGLDGYKMDKNILSVVPVAPKIDTVEQSRVNTKDTVIPCIEKIDNQVTNSFKAVLKVKNFATENKPKKKKTKKRKKNKKKRLQLAKQSTMMDSIKTETPLLLGDLIVQHPVKIEKDLISDPVQIKPTVSQPASTDQITEDTPSIRSVPLKQTIKRKKELTKSDELEIDMSEKKRFKFDVSAIESTKEESCVCVVITCGLTGHLSKDVADFVLDSIRNKLIEDSKIETIHIPVFTKNPIYIDGTVKLFCEDENAFDWLEPVVVNPDLMGGMPLIINKVNLKGKFLCGIVIPDREDILKNPCFILHLLSKQNLWIDVNSWQFVGSEPRSKNYFMKVLIPKDHLNILGRKKNKMAYCLGSVYVKFIGQANRLAKS